MQSSMSVKSEGASQKGVEWKMEEGVGETPSMQQLLYMQMQMMSQLQEQLVESRKASTVVGTEDHDVFKLKQKNAQTVV